MTQSKYKSVKILSSTKTHCPPFKDNIPFYRALESDINIMYIVLFILIRQCMIYFI